MQIGIDKTERDYLLALMCRDSLPEYLRVEPNDMAGTDTKLILKAVYDCEKEYGAWDQGAVYHHLQLTNEKWLTALERILEEAEPMIGAGPRAEMIRSAARARRCQAETALASEAFKEGRILDGIEVLEGLKVRESTADKRRDYELYEAIEEATKEARDRYSGEKSRITFNVQDFDDHIGGLTGGSMMTIGGVTSGCKSSLIIFLAVRMAKLGHRIGFVTLEDPKTTWGARGMAMFAGISTGWVHSNAIRSEDEIREFEYHADEARREGESLSIRMSDRKGCAPKEIMAAARELVTGYGADILFVDYLQAARFRATERYDKEVSNLSKQLKGLCSVNGIPLIIASQLRRRQSGSKLEPDIHDLKETGDLENESEVVLLLWQKDEKSLGLGIRFLAKLSKVKWKATGKYYELLFDRSIGMITGVQEIIK